jgi:acyl-coenzyme A synthetase/AMP-(fatty) acid ligase
MVPSVRNAEAGHLHVLENAHCTKLFHSIDFEKTANQLKCKKPELQTFQLASLNELLNANPEHYPYHKQWTTSWKEPVIIAHSSGSTGSLLCLH